MPRPAWLPPEIVAESDVIIDVYRELRDYARLPGHVLVLGETGTGKELAAQLVHHWSQRIGQPVIASIPAINGPTFVGELFGYAKGAYTGADKPYDGICLRADGGTLFLDEIGDVEEEHAPKLLRFLETGEIQPMQKPSRTVDVRVVGATDRDVAGMRPALLARLKWRVKLPSLHDRGAADKLALAKFYFAKVHVEYRSKLGRPLLDTQHPFTSGALDYIAEHPWPENVRGLRNAVERAVVLADGQITTKDLAGYDLAADADGRDRANADGSVGVAGGEQIDREIRQTWDEYAAAVLPRIKRDYFARALVQCHGDLKRTRELLGKSRTAVWRVLHDKGTDPGGAG